MGVINLGALVEKLKSKLSGSFVSNTDYASSSTGGVIKTDSTYATDITEAGKLKSKAITAANYDSANSAAFISKGTLDNLIAAGAFGGFTMEEVYADLEASNTARTMNIANFSTYKFFIVVCGYGNNVNASVLPPVPMMTTSDNYLINVKIGADMGKINMTHTTATTLETEATSAQLVYHVYGIK